MKKSNVKEIDVIDIKNRKVCFKGKIYTVLERKNELEKKPSYYLLNLEDKIYLSSLYPVGESNTYLFDDKDEGKYYLLRFYPNGYEIEELW